MQKISRFMARDMSLAEALQNVVTLVVEFMECDSCLLYLLEKNELVTLPANSPEHFFQPGLATSYGPTMDMQILRDLFADTIKAAEILGVDADLRTQLATTRSKLAPSQIGSAGQLQEWLEDWDLQAKDIHHRHIHHRLVGLEVAHDGGHAVGFEVDLDARLLAIGIGQFRQPGIEGDARRQDIDVGVCRAGGDEEGRE